MNDIKITTHEACVDMVRQTGNGKLEQVIPASVGFDPRGGQRMTGSGEVPLILVSESSLAVVEDDVRELSKLTEKLNEFSRLVPPSPARTLQLVGEAVDNLSRLALIARRLQRIFSSNGYDVPDIFYDGYCDDSEVL